MAGVYLIILFIRFFSNMAWLQRTRKRKCEGNHISDMKESTAFPRFILIGTPAKSMAKKSALSSMIARDLFWRAGNLMVQPVKQALNWLEKVLEDYGKIRRIREVITDHGPQFFAN